MQFRVGHGFDVHAFTEGNYLVLGGVKLPFEKAFKAHSDGDVLIHAICDALLGAAGMGDIGQHFPDTDPQFKGIDSRELLRNVINQIYLSGLVVGNLDATIVAQAPRLMPHLPAMQANLSMDMQVELDQVNIKATTTEKLGYTGRGEGVSAHAVVLLSKEI